MIETLKKRFSENLIRHKNTKWEDVEKKLDGNKEVINILKKMEETGGEPDVVEFDLKSDKLYFCDCCKETPLGRRSLCYDDEALKSRKANPPKGSALSQANEMGISLLDEEMYYKLQELDVFDSKTSSWIKAPESIRKEGGSLFCERRYGRVFTFHNGAESYYSVRGWRGYICI